MLDAAHLYESAEPFYIQEISGILDLIKAK